MVNTVIDVDINNERYSVLTYEQVERLDCVLQSTLPIHGRGNFPTLEVKLKDLVSVVRRKLEDDCINVRDIRMNGGAASNILASRVQSYNDVDLIFFVDLSSQRNFDKVKTAVLNSLMDFLPEGVSKTRISMKEGYVNKMVKVDDVDKWSLISLSNYGGRNIELKFVDTMKRQFEFSVDSFQILLDSILFFYDCTKMPINQNVYPTVIGDSVYGNFAEAFYHLTKKLFATKCPEEIRGGGLLKYCYLLVKNYKPVDDCDTKSMQRYMCSRFFIDFPDANQQLSKLEAYLCNHLVGADESLRVDYLNILYRVVNQSTVCLMGHERRQTLKLIDDLACRIYYSDLSSKESRQCSSPTDSCCSSKSSASSTSSCEVSQPLHPPPPPPPLIYSNGYYYAPIMPGPTSSSTIPQCTCGWVQCA